MDLAGCRPCRGWCWGSPDCQLLAGEGKAREVSIYGRRQVWSLSAKTFLSTILHPCSASSGCWGEKALAWQLHAGGLCFSLGEQEWIEQYVLSHWSLVQTYFKVCGSQQGSYVSLLIFTSVWSTLSKSTQLDLCRVINRPHLSGLPLLCSKSCLPFPGYTWHSWMLWLTFPLTTIQFLLRKKERFSFAWTLAHFSIKIIFLSKTAPGSGLSDRQMEERISSEQGTASLKSHRNLLWHLYQLMSTRYWYPFSSTLQSLLPQVHFTSASCCP